MPLDVQQNLGRISIIILLRTLCIITKILLRHAYLYKNYIYDMNIIRIEEKIIIKNNSNLKRNYSHIHTKITRLEFLCAQKTVSIVTSLQLFVKCFWYKF